ncbi:MAG: ABC transporter permease [Oscillospiraceae bacterium]
MSDKKMKKPVMGSLQVDLEKVDWNTLTPGDFEKATHDEKESFMADRKSVSYWHDAWRRLRRNTVAMVALVIIILLVLFAFVGPLIVPYGNSQQIRGSENLHPWHYTLEDQKKLADAQAENEAAADTGTLDPTEAVNIAKAKAAAEGKKLSASEISKIRIDVAMRVANASKTPAGDGEKSGAEQEDDLRRSLGIRPKLGGYSVTELEQKAEGESVFPHMFGTDKFGRDTMVRVMIGTRVSMIVGVCAALLVLVIGALYGSISGYCGGMVDTVMQRVVELIYSIPEVLVILLISATLAPTLQVFQNAGDGPLNKLVTLLGPNLISMFIAFGLLYWVTMSRIIRGQILQLKGQEYVTAARALGASGGRIIKQHLLPNCIGQIVVTTCLQIPSAIFLESFLSFLGVGVSAPLTSLGSMASEALAGLTTYPYRLMFPALILSVMILSFNLFGDGLRDALDPRLKK